MKQLINFFIEKSLVVNLLTVIIIVVGTVSAFFLQKEIFPQVEFDVVLVRTIYPGSSSEDVEKLVTLSIERSLKEVDGIKELNALSSEGLSLAYITIDPDADITEVEEDIKNAIDSIDDFPEEVEKPLVKSLSNKNRRGVIKIALYGAQYDRLRDVSKDLRDELELDKRISLIDIQGYRPDEIIALIDPDKLEKFYITLSEVALAIRASNTNISAGTIKTKNGDVFVRTLNEFETAEDVGNVVVRSNSTGRSVKVRDIAKVVRRPIEDGVLGRSNGEEALFLDVKIKGSSDIIKTTDYVKEVVTNFFAEDQYKNVKYTFVDDASYFVKRRLNVLKNNGALGMVLVFFSLLIFLNFSTSVVTSMGAPIAFMISFACMDMMGLSINLISMFGLILVLGMLVDDSIIVAEHFYQKLEDGHEPKDAARIAALETVKPVAATIITTMIAFGALFFMGGIMGKFLWPVPATVIICLAASFFECFFILPSHLADFVRLKKEKAKASKWYIKLVKSYGKILKFCIRIPGLTVLTFTIVFILSLLLAKSMNFELFPGDDVRTVFVQFKGKVGAPKETTSEKLLQVEREIYRAIPRNELQQIQSRVGLLIGDQGNKLGSHYGSIVLYLTDPAERERATDDIINDVKDRAVKIVGSEYEVLTQKVQGGPPRGKDVDIELTADSIETLKKAAKEVESKLAKVDGVVTTEIDFEEGNDQIIFNVNEDEAKRLGLDIQSVALELRRALAADEITQIKESDEDIEVKIQLNEDLVNDASPLLGLSILNKEGRRIPLKNLVTISNRPGAFVIRRFDRKRIFSVSASLDKTVTNSRKVALTFKDDVQSIVSKYKGLNFRFGGENEDTKESMAGLFKSFGIAFATIFLVLVLMFNSLAHPIIIMSAIPLGLIGVIISFKLFGVSLGFMAMMGVVGLVGVVINDSIVLVNFINIKREQVESLHQAIFEACLSRLRPVLLTTVTTVAGLMPLAHATGGDPFLKPMAMSFAWGLLFATGVTLIFVPTQYLFFEKIRNLLNYKQKVDLGSVQDISMIEESFESKLLHSEVKV